MKKKQTSEIIALRNEIDRLRKLVPAKRYCDCNKEERLRWSDVAKVQIRLREATGKHNEKSDAR